MKTSEWSPDAYPVTFVRDTATARVELADLAQAAQVAIDTETVIELDEEGNIIPRDLDVDGPGPWRVMSIAARFVAEDGQVTCKAWVLDMGYIDARELLDVFVGVRPFGWHANFDRFVLTRAGIPMVYWWDGMLADAVLRCGSGGGDGRKYTSLAKAARKMLGYDLDGKADTRLSYKTVAEEPELSADQIRYAAIDAIATLEVSLRLGALLKANDLVGTFVRECNAQPFIQMMVRAGLPLDVEGYSAIIAVAAEKSAEAAERIAVATTGRELLTTLVAWHAHTTGVPAPSAEDDNVISHGLELLHDPATFDAFVADVTARREACATRMGELLGVSATTDLFAEADDATFVPLPFDAANDTEVRAWLSKTAPHYTAAYVLAAREEGQFPHLLAMEAAAVLELAARRRKFTKDHDVDVVLAGIVQAQAADVTDTLRAVAAQLLDYRRYHRIVETYGHHSGAEAPARLVPTWNVGSDVQVKDMLNKFCPDEVAAYMTKVAGAARPLGKPDSVDADALKLIGGELCSALLAFRANDKIVTTYGDKLLSMVNGTTGRIHARYNQALVGTGRLASFKPNAQNLSPLAKPHMRPVLVDGKVARVLVCVDLSQAELRFVAHAAQDVNMLEAFRSGDDLHERTASLMFSIDLKSLKKHDTTPVDQLLEVVDGLGAYAAANPTAVVDEIIVDDIDPASGQKVGVKKTVSRKAYALHKELRQKAKKVAFGYAYGLKEAALAQGLTVDGVPTTKEEAKVLLDKFDEAYPQVAAWMKVRVDFIANLAGAMRDMERPSGVDFTATWKLHLTHAKSHSAYAALTRTLGRTPTDRELAERLKPNAAEVLAAQLGRDATAEEVDAHLGEVAKLAHWALDHDHAVVLADENTAWSFESRTTGGRRRLFQVPTDQLCMAVVSQVVRSRRTTINMVADAWLESWNARAAAEHAAKVEAKKARGPVPVLSLTKKVGNRTVGLESRELEKVFEDRAMRTDFVGFALQHMQAGQMEAVWRMAMADRIRAMGNQYRNHPIQGGVADAMMVAFHRITDDLVNFPSAQPIQSVHDSAVVEADVAEAAAVRDMVVGHMQDALASFCPTVPCVADGDIQMSLDADTKVSDEALATMSLVLAA